MPEAIIDACCLIDLYASGQFEPVLAASGFQWYIPSAVVAETQYIHQPSVDDPQVLVPVPIDLGPVIAKGVLTSCDLVPGQELTDFVSFAALFRSDGEAACLAIAKARGWTLATDDRKARREATAYNVSVVTTAELVKTWADTNATPESELGVVLRNIQVFARFLPHKTMPLHKWWADGASK